MFEFTITNYILLITLAQLITMLGLIKLYRLRGLLPLAYDADDWCCLLFLSGLFPLGLSLLIACGTISLYYFCKKVAIKFPQSLITNLRDL